MSVFVGTKYENKSLSNLAKLVDECEEFGIPVMAVSAVGKELEKEKPATLLWLQEFQRKLAHE
jgi:DhnA family fructose-bisphosphate aldolase class Ia